jgi:hypothetical protein
MPGNREENSNRVAELTDMLENGVEKLLQKEEYLTYLKVMSKFHNYSLNNQILIYLQNPDASLVAGYKSWESKFERHVKKGEKGISILAPCPYKITLNQKVLDPDSGKVMLDPDGNPVTKKVEHIIQAYRPVTVFDVSQTEGKEIPKYPFHPEELTGDVPYYDHMFTILKQISPVPITLEEIKNGAKGYFHLGEQRIVIQSGMAPLQTLKTAIHEISHAILHNTKSDNTEPTGMLSLNQKEVEAESVAFVVTQYLGLDTSDYSIPYVAGWTEGNTDLLKKSLETVRNAASQFIKDIEEQEEKIKVERAGKEPKIGEEIPEEIKREPQKHPCPSI